MHRIGMRQRQGVRSPARMRTRCRWTLGAPPASPLSGCSRFAPSRSSPHGDGLRPPCASLAREPGTGVPETSIDQTCLRHVEALAARRFLHASASSRCRFPEPFACPVTLRPRCRGTGFACKGVFITLARYEGFPLAPPSSRSRSFTGRRTQENGGQLRVGGRCVQEPFHKGLRI